MSQKRINGHWQWVNYIIPVISSSGESYLVDIVCIVHCIVCIILCIVFCALCIVLCVLYCASI